MAKKLIPGQPCPTCGKKWGIKNGRVKAEWVDGERFLNERIIPVTQWGGRGGHTRTVVNGYTLRPTDRDMMTIQQLKNKRRRKIFAATAERILSNVGLDPHVEDLLI